MQLVSLGLLTLYKLHLVGYLLTRYFKDARYHEHKIQYMLII